MPDFADGYLLNCPILDEDVQSFLSGMDSSPVVGGLEQSSCGTSTTAATPASWQVAVSPCITGPPTPQTQPDSLVPTKPPNGVPLTHRQKRKPVPRKGHTKSRRGCLNCKRRKVKCQENRPECGHCQKLGLPCEWPSATPPSRPGGRCAIGAARKTEPRPDVGVPVGVSMGRSMGTAGYGVQSGQGFSVQDLHFFQHFITVAYPPLPLGGGSIWKQVSAMAHHYDFLIHAMLGLGASHLSLCGGDAGELYTRPALAHRVAAMKSLNEFLSRPRFSKADGDAAFAAAMSLTFQSSYMEDGLVDFLAMVRGCEYSVSPTRRLP
jgi:hypothetical protein